MAIAKRKTTIGFAVASAYNDQPASPDTVVVCDSGNLQGEPFTYEQVNNMTPDNADIIAAGFNYTFNMGNIEPNITQAGMLFAIAFAGETINVDVHEIVPGDDDSNWMTVHRDLRTQVGATGTDVTEVAVGCKIQSLSFEVMRRTFVKMSASGAFCDMGTAATELTKALPTFPLSWHALRAGDYKIGIGGVAIASDRDITGFKMNYTREQNTEDNITLDDDQPNDITEGGRMFDFEITRQFGSAQALAEYNAHLAGSVVEIEVSFETDTDGTPQTLTISVPNARITGPYVGDVGTGNEPIEATLSLRAFKSGSDDIIKIVADDNTSVLWT